MKAEKIWSGLIGAVLSFAAAFAGVECLVSAFGFSADGETVALGLAVCAVMAAVCFSVKYGALLLAGIGAILLGYLAREGSVFLELEALLYQISKVYQSGYGWPVVQWSQGLRLDYMSVTGGLLLMGCGITILLCRMLCRSKRAIGPVLAALVPLFACCVVTDTVPAGGWLFGLLAVIVLIVLTQTVRRESGVQGQRLTALLLIPVLLVSAVAFQLMPREEYDNQTQAWQEWLVGLFEGVFGAPGNTPGQQNTLSIDLTAVGEGPKAQYAVMNVISSKTQTLYLRGQAYDVYDGLGWSVAEYEEEADIFWPAGGSVSGIVAIETRSGESIKYFPYYPAQTGWQQQISKGAMVNPDRQSSYSFDISDDGSLQSGNASMEMIRQCTQIPDSALTTANGILRRLFRSGSYTDSYKIKAIASYVQESAVYSLDTDRMPEDAEDFAVWFLKDSETGYCTHFATAAVILLRAAGYPARYVTGYMVDVTAGVKTTVRADMAHAWVEYLDPVSGCWQILDPTPVVEDPPETTEPSTEPTQPETTEPSTEPSVEPTLPEITKPSTAPTESSTRPVETTLPADPSQSTQAGGTGSGSAGYSRLWMVLAYLAVVAVAAVIAAGQYYLRRKIRRKRLYTGPENQQALRRWRYVQRVGRRMKTQPPERLRELAEKAKFSQHILTQQELDEFDAWLKQMRQRLQKKNWLQRTLHKLIWAVK